jgi:hypothetical protein
MSIKCTIAWILSVPPTVKGLEFSGTEIKEMLLCDGNIQVNEEIQLKDKSDAVTDYTVLTSVHRQTTGILFRLFNSHV